MLTRLAISNLATIRSLAIEWQDGFTVLTGETGAGKSILIGALRLVLGAKASPDQVRGGETQTAVEATFDISLLPQVAQQLAEQGIPAGPELILRRTLQESGRSRAFANECTISQPRLEALGTYLVSIHGQHDNQLLLDTATHVDFLDGFAGLRPAREEVARLHAQHGSLVRQRQEALARLAQRERRRAELEQEITEIREAGVEPKEEAALRQELAMLSNAEQLGALLQSAVETLADGELPLLQQLGQMTQAVRQAAQLDPSLDSVGAQLPPLAYQLEDVHRSLSQYIARLEANPGRIEAIQARLAELEKLKRKYGGKIEAVQARLAASQQEWEALERLEESGGQLDAEVRQVAGRLHALAEELSRSRHRAAQDFDRRLMEQLGDLGMLKARFQTELSPLPQDAGAIPGIGPNGMESVEFLLSTNPGQAPRPLARIASGGELSRTMLALKTVLAAVDPTRTLIFDEVDAGISGATAEIVGRKLKALGATHQVLCITHLPQIAAQAAWHFRVTKDSDGAQTYTRVAALAREEQVREIARMLSGVEVTDRSLASAEELVSLARQASEPGQDSAAQEGRNGPEAGLRRPVNG